MRNKSLLMTIVILLCAIYSLAQVTGTFTDSRDGKTYKTIKIGEQTWMAENLAFKANEGCWAYSNNESNIATYGYLYNWETAKNVCPSGFHLPSDAEWITLTSNYSGKDEAAGEKMKATSGWKDYDGKSGNGTNTSGFTALPGGFHSDTFNNIGYSGCWWSSTEANTTDAWVRDLGYNYSTVPRSYDTKTNWFSVRCLKN